MSAQLARGHRELLDAMARDARRRSHTAARPWDPARPPEELGLPDAGRGLLDCVALGLHVLWTYQQAWADEGGLRTARLPASVRRLLELVGYVPDPGFAATGLQHFRCREGAEASLPPGFRVSADATEELPAAVFETLRAVRLSWLLNELRPYLPAPPPAPSTAGAVSAALQLPEVSVPRPPAAVGASSFVDQVADRLAAARAGSLAQRNAVRARQQAQRVSEVMAQLRDAGAEQLCGEAFEELCHQLCEAQELANEAGFEPLPGPLSESQELLLSRLRAMAQSQPAAVDSLADALGRCAGESDADWSARLDRMTGFLDALVAGILQEARDQVVRLHGSRALTALDRSLGGPAAIGAAPSGVAPPGTDTLFVLPVPGTGTAAPVDPGALLRPGDWLVVAEDEPAGRAYREAVRVLRLRTEIPGGLREPATRVTFAPPLTRRYPLDRTVLVGNVVEVGHGSSVVEELRRADPADPLLPLGSGPLTWRRSAAPDAAEGRVPELELTVAGRRWTRVPDLRDAGPDTYAVEVTADGGSRVRLAEGGVPPSVPEGAEVTLAYRTELGPAGNRPALAVRTLAGPAPAVVETFNPLPLSGGVAAEAADVSAARGRAGVHALDRAVSVEDVVSLATSFGGIQDAAVVRDALRRRDHVTVVVVAAGGGVLTDADRGQLHDFLVARMPPGASVTVVDRDTVPVRTRLAVRVLAGSDPLAVVRAARARLGADPAELTGLLHPDAVRLGRSVHLSDLYGALAGIADLASVFVELLHRAGDPPARHDRIDVPATAVAAWAAPEPGLDPVEISWEEAGQP